MHAHARVIGLGRRHLQQPLPKQPVHQIEHVIGHRRRGAAHGDAVGKVAVHVQAPGLARRGEQGRMQGHVSGDGPRLQQVEPPFSESPLHVHRTAEKRLDALHRLGKRVQIRAR